MSNLKISHYFKTGFNIDLFSGFFAGGWALKKVLVGVFGKAQVPRPENPGDFVPVTAAPSSFIFSRNVQRNGKFMAISL